MTTIRYKQRGNRWYVYELNQYWDKELKKPRQSTKYLGVADSKGGEYSKPGLRPASPIENEILDLGDSYAIEKITKSIGLTEVIKDSFSNLDSIMTLACFQITEGSAMYNCKNWREGNIAKKLFPNAKVSSQDISRLIKLLGQQNLQTKFFRNYIAKFFPNKRGILIDSTALPSSINSSINAFGYASGNIEENVSCLMLVDKESSLPIYFRAIGGDIADISTVKTTVAEIKKLGLDTESVILDAGFCSKENLQFMCASQINFITRLPKSHKIFGEYIRATCDMENRSNAVQYGERIVFIKSYKTKVYGYDMYVHVILDPSKKSKDIKCILKDKLEENLSSKEELYLDAQMQEAGYFILLSKNEIESKQILPSYYARQAIEQVFGFAKSSNNILPLRVHDEQSIKGYLMLIFLALVIFIIMRQRVKIPMDKALITLRGLKAKIFDHEVLVQEPNKKIKDLFKDLNIIMPTKLGI
ncbi:MAG: transposase [Rickettsiaceae bacterium]|nr:transposase [Rickettsiaceae bacterium]